MTLRRKPFQRLFHLHAARPLEQHRVARRAPPAARDSPASAGSSKKCASTAWPARSGLDHGARAARARRSADRRRRPAAYRPTCAVQLARLRAQFEHLAEHGDAARGGRSRQHVEHRLRGLRVGVVAVVPDDDAADARSALAAHLAHGEACATASRAGVRRRFRTRAPPRSRPADSSRRGGPTAGSSKSHAVDAEARARRRRAPTSSARTSASSEKPKVIDRPGMDLAEAPHARIVGIQHGDAIGAAALRSTPAWRRRCLRWNRRTRRARSRRWSPRRYRAGRSRPARESRRRDSCPFRAPPRGSRRAGAAARAARRRDC